MYGNHRRQVDHLRNAVAKALAQAPELRVQVYLVGSWATGRFDGHSDVDLLVIASDDETARQAEQRLMEIAYDVIATTEARWEARLHDGHPFIRRLHHERQQLLDTTAGDADG